jgi:hypothetical protein
MSLIKSKKRVADHGEVFTPPWMVEAMLDLIKGETERIDSRFLEPACGSGNFLIRILQRKLVAVELRFGKSDFEKRQYALLTVMCLYGIELLADNIAECRANMLEILADYLTLEESNDFYRAASYVLSQILIHGDALTMRTGDGNPITFAEWGYLGKGKFQRRDFRFDILTHSSAFSAEGSLLSHLGKHEIFTPAIFYCEEAFSFLESCSMEDESYFIALIRMYERSLEYVLSLPPAQRATYLERLDKVRSRGRHVSWGVQDELNSLWYAAALALAAIVVHTNVQRAR